MDVIIKTIVCKTVCRHFQGSISRGNNASTDVLYSYSKMTVGMAKIKLRISMRIYIYTVMAFMCPQRKTTKKKS